MKFYHGTTKENWKKIKKEGCLWGIREIEGMHPSRCTYLAVDKEEGQKYGDVLLEIEYDPFKNTLENNYTEECWQVRVYEPILLKDITVIED